MKKIICTLLIICSLFSLVGCSTQKAITKFVQEKEAELLEAVETKDFSALEYNGFIKDVKVTASVVEFSCGGSGIGSATSYVGFYYTPDNDMTALWCAPSSADSLTPSGNGFAWKEPHGDNRYYTEHICGNFYYYKASF